MDSDPVASGQAGLVLDQAASVHSARAPGLSPEADSQRAEDSLPVEDLLREEHLPLAQSASPDLADAMYLSAQGSTASVLGALDSLINALAASLLSSLVVVFF